MDKNPSRQSIEITIKRWKVTLGTQNSLQRLFASFFLHVMQVFSPGMVANKMQKTCIKSNGTRFEYQCNSEKINTVLNQNIVVCD